MNEKDWTIYLIRCNNNALYTGITIDVQARFKEHQSGSKKAAKYLRGKQPLQLVFQQKVGKQGVALKLERKIKALSKKHKEELIEGKRQLFDLM